MFFIFTFFKIIISESGIELVEGQPEDGHIVLHMTPNQIMAQGDATILEITPTIQS